MKYYTIEEYLLIALAKYVDEVLEKADYAVKLEAMKGFKLNWLKQPEAMLEQPEFVNLRSMYIDCKERGGTGRLLPADQHISGLQDQSLWLHDHKALRRFGLYENGRKDIYKYLHDSFKELARRFGFRKEILDMSRKEFKTYIIPLFYNGEHKLKELLTENEFNRFMDFYGWVFPLAEQFRAQSLSVWKEDAYFDAWELPDGYQVRAPHEAVSDAIGFNWGGYAFYGKCKKLSKIPQYTYLYNGDKIRNAGTFSLAANITHSLDGFAHREIKYRCSMTVAQAEFILKECEKNGFSNRDPKHIGKIERIIDLARKTGIVSARLFYLLDSNPLVLPEDIHDYLKSMTSDFAETESFTPTSVHDEFSCNVRYMNAMRRIANTVFADIYNGHLQEYFNEVFGMNIQCEEPNEETFNAIRNWDYSLVI